MLRFAASDADIHEAIVTNLRHLSVFLVFVTAETWLSSGCTRPAPADRSAAAPSPTVPANASTPNLVGSAVPNLVPSASAPRVDSSHPSEAIAAVRCPTVNETMEPGVECGELHCLAFSSEAAAFRHLLKLNPLVLGIGESHAPKDVRGVHGAARRFGELMLPALCGRARSIVLELWLPRSDCGDRRVEEVKKEQEPVTRAQAKSNQDDYVTLGHVAKRFGIMPSALVPTCDEYESILDAKQAGIERMLELVGRRSGEQVLEELRKHPVQDEGPVVVTYGGALHNDAEPDQEHARYSYGPKLLEQTHGRYLELDLIVPEFVRDTEIWKRQPWYSAVKQNSQATKTRLLQWAPHSFALVFPRDSGLGPH